MTSMFAGSVGSDAAVGSLLFVLNVFEVSMCAGSTLDVVRNSTSLAITLQASYKLMAFCE